MTFKAASLPARIEGQDGPFPLRSVTGGRLEDADKSLLEAYIEAGVVCGVGSKQRLRYFQFVADDDEVSRAMIACNSKIGSERARAPLDFLLKMSSHRKFGGWVHKTVIQAGRTVAARYYEHNLERCEAQMSPRHVARA